MARPDTYPWIEGRLHSPHFVFLRTVDIPIPRLLTLLGYADAPACEFEFATPGLLFTRCSSWTHIVDDWLYTLWHRRDRLRVYEELSHEALLFTFAVGDTDESYEFAIYRDGTAVRRHVVISPNYSDRVVQESVGDPLPLEDSWLYQSDGEEIGFKLAESLGVELDQSARPLQCFSIPEPDWRGKRPPEAS